MNKVEIEPVFIESEASEVWDDEHRVNPNKPLIGSKLVYHADHITPDVAKQIKKYVDDESKRGDYFKIDVEITNK